MNVGDLNWVVSAIFIPVGFYFNNKINQIERDKEDKFNAVHDELFDFKLKVANEYINKSEIKEMISDLKVDLHERLDKMEKNLKQ